MPPWSLPDRHSAGKGRLVWGMPTTPASGPSAAPAPSAGVVPTVSGAKVPFHAQIERRPTGNSRTTANATNASKTIQNTHIGQATGDPLAEQLHAALIRAPDGLTRTQLSHHVHRNLPSEQLDRALQALTAAGRARHTRINTGGRPAERWHASLPA